MNVYLVYWSNGETYVDYIERVVMVFANYNDAVRYIESVGYVLDPEYSCRRKMWTRFNGAYEGIESMWIREMEVIE